MLRSALNCSGDFVKCLPSRQMAISIIKDHVPLIKFRAHQSIEDAAEPTPFSLENNPAEPSLHPNFFRKPISEEELDNFQRGGLNM
ncbi:unnamed protein product [Hymenolepis diminuta]|uniref:Uncharacterized protein n=1 Tax=Hymenolepis diminuta TaxID=6216 RepID=A0A564YWI6_HYMDI|nr:unnamed protein product [Hymenolepis diminuta]